ncbi:MAG: hypothetical protein ACI8Z7_000297 [Candidatus Nanohaloarchaea archaeon]|jgi:hypothetical protein
MEAEIDLDPRNMLVATAVLIVSVGAGFVIGDYIQQDSEIDLYAENFNKTLNADNREETVQFDNRTARLTYENWEEFRAYLEYGDTERQLNTTSDGERRTLSEIVVLENEAYRFYFRYRDDPEGNTGDFLQLYRIEQMQ